MVQAGQVCGEQVRAARSRSSPRSCATPPTSTSSWPDPGCSVRPAAGRPGSGWWTPRRASAQAPSGPAIGAVEHLVAGAANSPAWSVAHIHGRVTGTRLPSNMTDPRSVPCLVAVRSGSCLPRGPHAAVTSVSINGAINLQPGTHCELAITARSHRPAGRRCGGPARGLEPLADGGTICPPVAAGEGRNLHV